LVVSAARRVPPWGWLAAIAGVSFLLRASLARGMVGPFIMVDELIYSELARSFAADGAFQVRDAPAAGFSLVYPVLISPAYLFVDALPTAYAVVKTLNAAFMSLAAVPAYLLARRMLAPPLALLAAILTVAVPSMVYTGTVMTENVFYPLFLTASLALVLVLEKPTLARQLGLFVLVGLCFATRAQAVAFIPAILLAPLLLVVLAGRPVRDLTRFRTLYALVGAGTVAVIAAQALRGHSPSDLLGAYSIVGDRSYDPETVARFFLYHLAELDLYLGVLPFAAFLLLVVAVRRLDPPVAPFLAAGIALSVSVLLVVAAFASVFANRIQERNTFVVAPFFLIALLVWLEHGLMRPRVRTAAVAAAAALLPLTIPWERFIETGAISDTLALLPIWSAFGSLLHDSIDLTVLAGGALAAVLFLLVPRRYALALPLATLLYFALVSNNVWFGEHGFKQASGGALFSGIRTGDRDWIDDAVPKGTKVAVVWTGVTDRFVVNQNEFFNRSVGPIYYVGGPTPGGLAETEVRVDEQDGSVRLADGSALDTPYVLLESTISPDGSALARDAGLGVTLWRLDQPLVSTKTEITGLYPNDTWSGPKVTYVRRNCHGGRLNVALSSDPMLFERAQTVVARVGGRVVSRVRLEPDGRATIRVPLRPVNGDCRVDFEVSPTKVPKGDPRELGAHFNDFFVSR
jgi:hypothetical protein